MIRLIIRDDPDNKSRIESRNIIDIYFVACCIPVYVVPNLSKAIFDQRDQTIDLIAIAKFQVGKYLLIRTYVK